LLAFKWNAFARFSFLVETALFCLHVAIASSYNLAVADNIGTPARVLCGLEPNTTPNYLLLVGWVWTSTYSVAKGLGELKQLRAGGYDGIEYITDVTNILDLVIVFGQVFINTCFWFIDERTDLFFRYWVWFPEEIANTTNATARRLDEIDPFGGSAHRHHAQINPDAGRMLKASSGGSSASGDISTDWESVGGFQVIEAVVVMALFTRMVFYFRGSLQFGALVHLLTKVFADMSAFLLLLVMALLTFAFSMRILFTSTRYSDNRVTGFPTLASAIFASVNMGLYGQFEPISLESSVPSALAFEGFMFVVQVVLLNLLIAIMSESHTRVRTVALLVAHFERAKMIVDHEKLLQARIMKHHFLLGRLFSQKQDPDAAQQVNRAMPRWLHILQPEDNMESASNEANSEASSEAAASNGAFSKKQGEQLAEMKKEIASVKKMTSELIMNQLKLKEVVTYAIDGERERHAQHLQEERAMLERMLTSVVVHPAPISKSAAAKSPAVSAEPAAPTNTVATIFDTFRHGFCSSRPPDSPNPTTVTTTVGFRGSIAEQSGAGGSSSGRSPTYARRLSGGSIRQNDLDSITSIMKSSPSKLRREPSGRSVSMKGHDGREPRTSVEKVNGGCGSLLVA